MKPLESKWSDCAKPPKKMSKFYGRLKNSAGNGPSALIIKSEEENTFSSSELVARTKMFDLCKNVSNLNLYLCARRTHTHMFSMNGGLEAGDKLCLTEVPFALEGWPVNVTDEAGLKVEAVVETDAAPSARPPRAPAGGAGGPVGDRVDSTLALLGDGVPEELKAKLLAIKESGDFSHMRPVMAEAREWAEKNGIELPAGGRGGGG